MGCSGERPPRTELEYRKGKRQGEAKFYYSTGHLLCEGKYKKGKRTGNWQYYNCLLYTSLENRNMVVHIRKSKGKDIDAACGQLANKRKD